jgi:hypothetical protein
MSTRARISAPIPTRPLTSFPFRSLQRKCACGGSGGECADCKRERLQRSATGNASEMAPPIVHEVLRSPGEPLESAARAYFEPRFGHDFSNVRLHTDTKAAESAQAVNALAYTVGNDIVFANPPSVLGTAEGTRILAHELTHVLQQSGVSDSRAAVQVGSIDSPFEREADHAANAVLSNQHSAPTMHAGAPALQRQTGQTPTQTPKQTPAQTPGQAPAEAVWGSKKWEGFENDWNAFYQLAIQGLAGSSLKPDKMPHLAAMIADLSMVLCFKHGKEAKCAVAAATDQDSKDTLDLFLPWGPNALWGQTFRSALQSTTAGVDGPISANKAVQRAGDIADQALRGMVGDAAWKIYMNCKTTGGSSSSATPPQAAASGKH